MKIRWRRVPLYALGLFGLIQLVPYGRDHTNPPVTGAATWDTPETQALAKRACFDCHSNETVWPWYSHVAPLSWVIQHHVDEGRGELNFSAFDQPRARRHAQDTVEEIEEGEMPMAGYVALHPEAKFTDAERAALIAGLKASFGEKKAGKDEHGEKHDEKHEEKHDH